MSSPSSPSSSPPNADSSSSSPTLSALSTSTTPHRSPSKPLNQTTPLPPLPFGGPLKIAKRRRLDPFGPGANQLLSSPSSSAALGAGGVRPFVTPVKSRSFSSPLIPQRRAPSLQDSPIPVLSPPPLLAPGAVGSEVELDRELITWRRKVDTARQARLYVQRREQEAETQKVTEIWREVAEKAANILFEQASERMERMGGIESYLQMQKDRDIAFGSFEEEVDYESLTEEEKIRYDEMKEESELANEDKKKEEPIEFDIKFMLKSMNVDYKAIYPGDEDSDEDE